MLVDVHRLRTIKANIHEQVAKLTMCDRITTPNDPGGLSKAVDREPAYDDLELAVDDRVPELTGQPTASADLVGLPKTADDETEQRREQPKNDVGERRHDAP